MNVVIVDDCNIACFVHKKLLNEIDENIHVRTYLCSQNFLDDLKQNNIYYPDIVLTDYNLGNSKPNGVELIHEINNYKFNNKIEDKFDTYLVSSETNIVSIADQCDNSVFKGFFMKPLRPRHLKEVLKNYYTV